MWLDFHEPFSAITHGLWAILVIPAWYYMVKSVTHLGSQVVLHIFMLTTFLCYSSSFLYHATAPPYTESFRTCDHICIFLLIAGTYTPIAWKLCKGYRPIIIVWLIAFSGIFIRIYLDYASEFLYIALGWGMIFASQELLKALFRKDYWLIHLGGLFYTVGGILEFLHVPTIIDKVIEHHEVFHLLVMSGTSCHYWFVWRELRNDRPKVCNKIRQDRRRARRIRPV